jgi:hypothetical protein
MAHVAEEKAMGIVVVSTTCPFCGGTEPLMRSETDLTDVTLSDQFRGTTVRCIHAGCEKSYAIRHGDLKIRRELLPR